MHCNCAIFHSYTPTDIPMQSPDGNQLGCPGPSLWKLITEHVHGSELPKIRTALGHSLVDMYIEVHSEVSFSESDFLVRAFIFRCFIIYVFFPPAYCFILLKAQTGSVSKMILQEYHSTE